MWIDCSRRPNHSRRVVRHVRRGDRDLGRKQVVAPAPPARPEHVVARSRPPARRPPPPPEAPARRQRHRAPKSAAGSCRSSFRSDAESALQSLLPRRLLSRYIGMLLFSVHAPQSARVPGPRPRSLPPGKADSLLPADGQRGGPPAHRGGLSGVQRRAAVRGVPHLRRQDAGPRERHDDRPDRRRRADARRARRLRHRADGARAWSTS